MKHIRRALIGIHLFVGIGGMFGGLAAIMDPFSPLGAPTSALKNAPFSDFLIPGILLFTVIGMGNVASAAMFPFRWKYQGYLSSVFSWALVVWIAVQCVMLQAIAPLHVVFFAIGLISAGLAMALLFEQRLFPANLALALLARFNGKEKSA